MLGWFHRWRANRNADLQKARALIDTHGAQARDIVIAQIRNLEGTRQDCRSTWAVYKHVNQLLGRDGLDTATRMSERS